MPAAPLEAGVGPPSPAPNAGIAAVVSGAGPTVLALTTSDIPADLRAEAGADGMRVHDVPISAGVVVDKQPNAFFKVQLNDTEHMVLATISGRMRRNRIRILMGDKVDIELSPYDLTKGRITYRHK